MNETIEQIQQLQNRIEEHNSSECEDRERVLFWPLNGGLHVEFYGLPWRNPFVDVINTLALPQVAPTLKSLAFRGPDEGANGTKEWDFTKLINSDVTFPELNTLFVELGNPSMEHNSVILGNGYEEEGQIARLLKKMPSLHSLTVPSAPSAAFFQLREHPLTYLRVEAGYEHQDFILNLSRSSCFPNLRTLDFGDYSFWHVIDGPSSERTPTEHYFELARSKAFGNVSVFRLRNSDLTDEQADELYRSVQGRYFELYIANEKQWSHGSSRPTPNR